MIDVEFIIRNFRCFGDEPTNLRVSDGFVALVGTNNSGKSSLLRMLYELRPLLSTLAAGTDNGSNEGSKLLRGAEGHWAPTILSGERVHRAGADRDITISVIVRDSAAGQFLFDNQQVVVDLTLRSSGLVSSVVRLGSGRILGNPSEPLGPGGTGVAPFATAMAELANSMYIGPFRNVMHVGTQEGYYDIKTGDAFVNTFGLYKSGPSAADNEAVTQLIKEIRRIFGFETLDINPAIGGKTLQLTVDDLSFRLTEQGAGLAHFVIVLVNAMVRKPSFLLIDEPELNLHASLQLDFLSTLARYTKCGVVFATHSLGLARTAADRVYTLTRSEGKISRASLYENDRNLVTLLGQLSFDKRPGLGYSRVMLVEGKSELRAIAQLLRRYGKEHEVLLLPLHGGDMIRGDVQQELIDLKRLGGEIKYLIDSERTVENEPLSRDRQDFVDLCVSLDIEGLVLKYRALENYFSDRAVKRAFGENMKALGPYEKKGAAQGWPKAANWRIAAEQTLTELDSTDLGDFLKDA